MSVAESVVVIGLFWFLVLWAMRDRRRLIARLEIERGLRTAYAEQNKALVDQVFRLKVALESEKVQANVEAMNCQWFYGQLAITRAAMERQLAMSRVRSHN